MSISGGSFEVEEREEVVERIGGEEVGCCCFCWALDFRWKKEVRN